MNGCDLTVKANCGAVAQAINRIARRVNKKLVQLEKDRLGLNQDQGHLNSLDQLQRALTKQISRWDKDCNDRGPGPGPGIRALPSAQWQATPDSGWLFPPMIVPPPLLSPSRVPSGLPNGAGWGTAGVAGVVIAVIAAITGRFDSVTEPNPWLDQVATQWWHQYRARYGVNGDPDYVSADDRVGDIAMALFESVFTLDIAIEAFAAIAEGPTELAYIGTDFLEEAGDILGMESVLQILDDVDLPRASIELIRSGINPSLLPGGGAP